MMHLTNHIKAVVQSMMSRQGVSRWGIVTSINPGIPAAKVMLQPDQVETGYLPIKCGAAGGMNVIALPSVGDQVMVHPDCGDMENGVISGASHGGAAVPPVSPATGMVPQPGEFFVGSAQAYIHIVGPNVFIGGTLVKVLAPVQATGDVTAGFGTGDQVDVLMHTHPVPDVSTGSTTVTTSPPNAGT